MNKFSTAKRYITAILAHALLSGYHFILNIALVRSLDISDYGIYALAFVVGILGASLSNALVSAPLSVYTPGVDRRAKRVFLETLLSTVNVLLIVAIVITGLLASLFFSIPMDVSAVFIGFVAAYTARQYSRTFAFARHKPQVALYGDITYVTVSLCMLLSGVFFLGNSLTVKFVLASLMLGNLAAILAELAILGVGVRLVFRIRSLKKYLDIWADVRWALVGSVTTILQMHAHSILITLFAGPAAFAPLAAGNVLLGPVRVGFQAWQNVVRPEMAVAIAKSKKASVIKTLGYSISMLVLGVICVAAGIYFAWDLIYASLYAEKYADSPMGWIVLGWCVVTLFSSAYVGPSGILQAFKEFKQLAFATVYGSMLSLTAVGVLLMLFSPPYSLLGLMLAECFLAVYLLFCVKSKLDKPW